MKRITIMLFGAVVVLLIINGSTVVHAQGVDPIQIEKEINILASELQLGKPVSTLQRTDAPRRIISPAAEIWMREFERGRLYWSVLGVVAVKGDILKTWLKRGGERGEFGLPLSNEVACSAPEGRAQLFESATLYWHASNREVTIHPLPNPLAPNEWFRSCRSAPAKPEPDRIGRFRVVLTGFSVERQTDDNVVDSDGKGDEIFIVAEVAQYANTEGRPQPPQPPQNPLFAFNPLLTLRRTLTSIVMGDANNQEVPRIRAGTAGNNGGLRTGDQFPTKEPWKQVGALSTNRLPMQVWEGELSGQGMVIIVPTIWEWDDGNVRAREQFNQDMNVYFNAGPEYPQRHRLSVREVRASDVFGAGDRPIGVLDEPPTIRLYYNTAVGAVQQSDRHGPGEFEIVYAGNAEKYRLYYKVERLP
ncbi:MAG TPA: hypothetical protein VL866_12565 [Pyrinomonadaceae bacterium]|nr:hypothetical protein [Pyrinomonadaceae bacterium]